MSSYNRIILLGNVTRDPQMTYMASQTPVTEIGLAVNRKWKGADGQKKEEVMFVDCKAFGKQAETINQYVKKGQPILIEGRLTLDSWEKDGQKRSKHRVTIEGFQFLGTGDKLKEPEARSAAPQRQFQDDAPSVEDCPF
jgi:single-strand DNA-binding protein